MALLNTCKSVRRHVFVIVYLRQKMSSDKIRKKTLYWSGPVHILKYWPVNIRKYWPATLTKTKRENKNVKYNIIQLWTFYEVNMLYMDLLRLYWPRTKSEVNIILIIGPYITYWQSKKSLITYVMYYSCHWN